MRARGDDRCLLRLCFGVLRSQLSVCTNTYPEQHTVGGEIRCCVRTQYWFVWASSVYSVCARAHQVIPLNDVFNDRGAYTTQVDEGAAIMLFEHMAHEASLTETRTEDACGDLASLTLNMNNQRPKLSRL